MTDAAQRAIIVMTIGWPLFSGLVAWASRRLGQLDRDQVWLGAHRQVLAETPTDETARVLLRVMDIAMPPKGAK